MVNDFNVATYGAVGDGVTDDSAAIRSAIAAASGGGRVVLPNGTYLVSQDGSNAWCLDLPSNVTLRGQSRSGVVIKMAASQAGFVRPISATGETGVAVENLTINGNKANQSVEEHRAGVFFTDCTRSVIRDVTSFDNTGDGFGVHGASSDVLVENCHAYDNDRSGVAVHGGGAARVTIRRCQLLDNAAQQIDTEFDSGYSMTDLLVEGCHLRALAGTSDWALTLSGSSVSAVSKRMTVRDCFIEGPVYVVWCLDVLFEGTRVVTRSADVGPALMAFRRSDVVAHGCRFETNNSSYGTYGSCAVQAEGVSSATDRPSLILRDCKVVQNSSGAAGVYLNNPVDVLIDGNHIQGPSNGYSGVDVRVTVSHPSRSLVITRNRIVDFGRAIVAGSVDGNQALQSMAVQDNLFIKDANTSANVALDLRSDNYDVVKQLTTGGNLRIGVTSLFGGTYGGRPDVATLLAGDFGAGLYQA